MRTFNGAIERCHFTLIRLSSRSIADTGDVTAAELATSGVADCVVDARWRCFDLRGTAPFVTSGPVVDSATSTGCLCKQQLTEVIRHLLESLHVREPKPSFTWSQTTTDFQPYKSGLYTAFQKTNRTHAINLIWHNFINTQHLLISFGRERHYSVLS